MVEGVERTVIGGVVEWWSARFDHRSVEKRASRDGGVEIRDESLGIGTHAIIRIGGDDNGGVEMRTKGLCCGKRVHGGLPTTYSTWC